MHQLLRLSAAALSLGYLTLASGSHAAPVSRPPLILAPSIEGWFICDEAAGNAKLITLEELFNFCRTRGLDGAPAIEQLLDKLEPGGPQGSVQVGYTITLPLLTLYRHTAQGWEIDTSRVESFLNVIRKVERPVVVYLMADHFDSTGPIVVDLAQDPRNLMRLRDDKPLELGYFGYRIMPYTLSADAAVPVNQYRFKALQYVAKKILELPEPVQKRIVAYTLPGELHHMFPDFENGMGAYQSIQVTDYSPDSVAGFRRWLQSKYKDVGQLKKQTGLDYPSFDAVPAPSKDIRKERLSSFGEHYDAFAGGTLPIAGWLWDPEQAVKKLDLYLDGKFVAPVTRGLGRLDVYRAVDAITDPNTGFRHDLDYRDLPSGKHIAQVVAATHERRYLLANVEFMVVPRDQSKVSAQPPKRLGWMQRISTLRGVRSWLDMPAGPQDLYYNPLAQDWNTYRESQVYGLLKAFHKRALDAGLPADKIYSHQIAANVNSSWNPQLLASGTTIGGDTPWRTGVNMYGGTTNSEWMRSFMKQRGITSYGVPEFNPQQWKREGGHLKALQSHYDGGATFISPYYFSLIPARLSGAAEHGVNRMELSPDNPKDGSDKFYKAIVEFARQ